MIAVVNIDGRQLKVEKNQEIYINRISGKEGDKLTLETVSLIEDGDKITIGAPLINGVKVNISIVEHTKGEKIIVIEVIDLSSGSYTTEISTESSIFPCFW